LSGEARKLQRWFKLSLLTGAPRLLARAGLAKLGSPLSLPTGGWRASHPERGLLI